MEGNIFENMFIIYRIIRICFLRVLNWNNLFYKIIKEIYFSYVLYLKSKYLVNIVCGMRELVIMIDFMDELFMMFIRLWKSVLRDICVVFLGLSIVVKSMRWMILL